MKSDVEKTDKLGEPPLQEISLQAEILHRFQSGYPRLYELFERSNHSHPENYFRRHLKDFEFEPDLWRRAFKPMDHRLQQLDPRAWAQLSEKAIPAITQRTREPRPKR